MSIDGTPDEQLQNEEPLTQVGLLGALARLANERTTSVFTPHLDAPKARLVKAYAEDGQPGVVVKVGGEVVGKYTVNTSKPKIVVDEENEEALDAYAEQHEGIEVIIRRNPVWEEALLKHCTRDDETGEIVDTRTGEVVPGLKYESGGKATGNITFTWAEKEVGRNRLLQAWQRGELDHMLTGVPELMAGARPAAENA
ncbi:hypothetical protein ACIO3O_37175 [Streptomyces sp. NPDC087440]|uniref:hypothetical protein n=1 Tax=Streptomyces sp. NPDC087440 TaxID=3365790 RepID=UPI00382C156B